MNKKYYLMRIPFVDDDFLVASLQAHPDITTSESLLLDDYFEKQEEYKDVDVLIGYLYESVSYFEPDRIPLTVLGDPQRRTVNHYRKLHSIGAYSKSLLEFLSDVYYEELLESFQLRSFLLSADQLSINNSEDIELSRYTLFNAQKVFGKVVNRLRNYEVVGLDYMRYFTLLAFSKSLGVTLVDQDLPLPDIILTPEVTNEEEHILINQKLLSLNKEDHELMEIIEMWLLDKLGSKHND